MKKIYFIFIVIVFLLTAFKPLKETLFTSPTYFPKPVYNFSKNSLSKNKIELGRKLFYDPILSINNSTSCASCHSSYNAFAHTDHALSHGIYDSIGTRNAPALFNLAWQPIFMWDGAINHLDMQALAPISNKIEMGETIQHVVKKLQEHPNYPSLFYKAFGDSIITGEHVLKSISQFMLTITSTHAKYDSVMLKKATFTAQEKNGYVLFKKHCNSCHTEPLFTNFSFQNNGLPMDTFLNDIGRMKITQHAKDSLTFKVPTLRNLEYSYPYMHDGRFKKLNEVLQFYTSEKKITPTLAAQLQTPILLSSNEKVDLIAFLLTLNDKQFVFEKKYSFPH